MTDKIIEDIFHIKSVSKKKVTIDRIRAHQLKTDDDNNDDWSTEKLESMLSDLIDQNIIELIGDTCKIKQTQEDTLTGNTQVAIITMMVPETQNNTHITSFTIPETQNLHLLYFERLKKTLANHWKYHILLKDPLNLLKRILHITLLLSRIFS